MLVTAWESRWPPDIKKDIPGHGLLSVPGKKCSWHRQPAMLAQCMHGPDAMHGPVP